MSGLTPLLLLLSLLSLLPYALPSGLTFTQLTGEGGFPPRQNAHLALLPTPQRYFDIDLNRTVTVPPNSFLLYGGEFDCVTDVWLSPPFDRTHWSLISGYTSFDDCEGPWTLSAYPNSSYSATQGRMHTASRSTGRTFLLGGWSPTVADRQLNEVWYSDNTANHITWTLSPPSHSFTPRAMGAAIALDPPSSYNSSTLLFLVGGVSTTGLLNDVWTSKDAGLSWTLLTVAAPFTPRQDLMLTGYWPAGSFSPHLYVIGGMAANASSPFGADVARDVWTSTDGRTWTALPDAPFAPRARSGVVATEGGVLMVVGGATTVSHGTYDSWVMLGEVWASFDGGVGWWNCTEGGEGGEGWGGREMPSVVVDEGGFVHVLGGLKGWPSYGESDVWRSDVSVFDTKQLMQACGVKGAEEKVREQEEQEVVVVQKREVSCPRCRAQSHTE